ncbi:hypothetical protein K438DRAFT_1972264 [Mycena galopus ATCC 62051]|nr:hypothetical protein K438DRAFT_1972264 [Mycena galopus ATCC 62051]
MAVLIILLASSVASKSKSKPKPKKAATEDEDDVLPSQSDDDKESESASHSSDEDESLSNMLDEVRLFPARLPCSPTPEDDIFDLPHRRRSSSSVGFAAPDTDFDLDINDNGQEDTSEGFPNIGRHYRHFGICQQHHLPRH